jgi:circadian clock protein KaiC
LVSIRELRMDSGVVQVGEVLRDFHGVLTGVPIYHGSAGPLLEDPGDGEHD